MQQEAFKVKEKTAGGMQEMENLNQKATLINFQLRNKGSPGELEAMASYSLEEVMIWALK